MRSVPVPDAAVLTMRSGHELRYAHGASVGRGYTVDPGVDPMQLRSRWAGSLLPALFAGALVPGAAGVGCRSTTATPTPPRPTVRLATGLPGGGFNQTGAYFQSEFSRLLPDLTVEIAETRGAIDNVEAIERGEADLALTYADVAYLAVSGRLEGHQVPFRNLAAVAVLPTAALHILASPTSRIVAIGQLQGRHIGFGGPTRSGSAMTARLVMDAFGLTADARGLDNASFDRATRELSTGALDGYLQMGHPPVAWVGRALAGGVRLVPLSPAQVQSLVSRYQFLRPFVLRPTDYAELTSSVQTVGVEGLLVCRRDLGTELVFRLTRAFFEMERRPEVTGEIPWRDSTALATPIALHDGAARYARERSLR